MSTALAQHAIATNRAEYAEGLNNDILYVPAREVLKRKEPSDVGTVWVYPAVVDGVH